MGYKSKRRRNREKQLDSNGQPKPDTRPNRPQKDDYTPMVKENDKFERYYQAQQLISGEEWPLLMSTLREGLPAAFRITSFFGQQAKALRQIVEGPAFRSLIDGTGDDPEQNKILQCLPWYPDRLAWQINLSRQEIRKSESTIRLHNFLISESESGYISRQEAVSMIPPLVLDIKPHHRVLDMCAAPGSKTAQIIELLHADHESASEFAKVSGVVVANDVDNKRCYMLVHQAKRLHSPCFVITNHDAGSMPRFYETVGNVEREIKFDRVLCDAPCSGDGTLRKNLDIWKNWTVSTGNHFHRAQIRIAKRGLELLAKDGLLVYSTCSLNPLEDEAVVANLLQESQGGLELIDVAHKLPGLKFIPGLEKWVVMDRDLKVFPNYESTHEKEKGYIKESMFPPSNIKEFGMNKCIRILPHLQDTGGFFIAVLKKTVHALPWERPSKQDQENIQDIEEPDEPAEPPKKKTRFPKGTYKEDPFFFFDGKEPEVGLIKDYYKITDEFPMTQLSHRSKGRVRNIYFLTESAKKIIDGNADRIKFINAGVRLFTRGSDKEAKCEYRLSQEGLAAVFPFIDSSYPISITKEDAELILTSEDSRFEALSEQVQSKLASLPPGSCVLVFRLKLNNSEHDEVTVPIAAWKGKVTLRPYIAKNERIHYLRVCGIDTTKIEDEARQKFEEKQERKAQRREAYGQDQQDVDPRIEHS